ncbi:MAG: Maf family nucleotide pyrophosphatase [Enterobacterales bacterium]|nr:Maf family nucleotide pyrophosphatase [Enterobacterales bacterium]
MQAKIILASSSVYRKALLKQIVSEFDGLSPDIDETPLTNESVQQLTKRLAQAKAEKIAQQQPNAIVIGADQVAICDGILLGKPGCYEKALQQLSFCSGKQALFITSVCVIHQTSQLMLSALSQVDLRFLQLSEDSIAQYLKLDKPYDCAGSFKVESYGIRLFESIKSDDPTSLQGLPLITLNRMLKQVNQHIQNQAADKLDQ